MIRVAIASDHAGFELTKVVIAHLQDKGYSIKDFGTFSSESCDYPDFGHPAAQSVVNGECDLGVGICSSGNGMQMTLNKYPQIRAALCWEPDLAALARQHNNANFVVLPANFISKEKALEIVDTFFASEFEGGRHLRRVNKIPINISVEGEVLG